MNFNEFYFIDLNNKTQVSEVKKFLNEFNLKYDLVDTTLVLKNENNNIIATCSKLNNVLKCIAIKNEYSNQNILNKLITEITKVIYSEGNEEIFVFTKPENKSIFESLNFEKIFSNDKIVFLTNKIDFFNKYKNYIESFYENKNTAVLVMNCNPLTKGHDFLINYASLNYEKVFIIPVKEDVSLFSYNERIEMLRNNILKYNNVILFIGSQYLISKSTFPSYFLNSEEEIIIAQSEIDVNIFMKLFEKFLPNLTRIVGSEPNSKTTNLYNDVLKINLIKYKFNFLEIERLKINDKYISASEVRKNIYENKSWEHLVPETTVNIIKKIDFKSRMDKKLIYKNN